jgi:TatD DNase family protein
MRLLIDTHSHIHDAEFGSDAQSALMRAREAGVARIITLGVNREDSERAVAFAGRHEGVFAAAGVHPHDAKGASDEDLNALEALAASDEVVAVGEIGLDFYRNLSPHDVQERAFRHQLETAARVGKPVCVHARDAEREAFEQLDAWSRRLGGCLPGGRPMGVMHYFAGDANLAMRYVELGFFISVHTSVTHPNRHTLHDVARRVPLERLVLETDSPYGAPQRYRGKRNEPAYVAESAARVAELKGIEIDEVARVTTENAANLFGLRVPAEAC